MSKGPQITDEQNERALAVIEAKIGNGLTEAGLGDELGVSQQYVNMWRNNKRRVGRRYYEILIGEAPAPANVSDPLERVLATEWWSPDPVPLPAVYAQTRREAREARDGVDDALPDSYWAAYLRRRAGELAAHKALDAEVAGVPKRRAKSRRGAR